MLYQDKIKVGGQHTSHYVRYENQTLHIEKVQETDDGEYECSVSTSPDLLVVKHRLNVLVPPRIKSATANKGSSEVLTHFCCTYLCCLKISSIISSYQYNCSKFIKNVFVNEMCR